MRTKSSSPFLLTLLIAASPAFACDQGASLCGGSSANAGAISGSEAISGSTSSSNSNAVSVANPVAISAPTINSNPNASASTGSSAANIGQQDLSSSAAINFAPVFEATKIAPSAPTAANTPLVSPSVFASAPVAGNMLNGKVFESFVNACGLNYANRPRTVEYSEGLSNILISLHPSLPSTGKPDEPKAVSVVFPERLQGVSCAGIIYASGKKPGTSPQTVFTDMVQAIQEESLIPSGRYVIAAFSSAVGFTIEAGSGSLGFSASPGGSWVPDNAQRLIQFLGGISGSRGETGYNFTPQITAALFRVDPEYGKSFDFRAISSNAEPTAKTMLDREESPKTIGRRAKQSVAR